VNPNYPEVAERANGRCEYCRAPQRAFNFPLEVEHVVPLASNGFRDPDNLALSCRSSNAFKSFRLTAVDPQTNKSALLFNPRRDAWFEHFALGETGDQLEG
jgi:hypothetical protein